MRKLLRQEDGIALVMALAYSIALATLVIGTTAYVTSNENGATNSSAKQTARSYAEAALNSAYSRLEWSNQQTQIYAGYNPAEADLLGCAKVTAAEITAGAPSGSSDCTSPTKLCLRFVGTGTCTAGTAGTATVYGFYTGVGDATKQFQGITETAATWILVATGYTGNSVPGHTSAQTVLGTAQIEGGGSGAVAAVWNHVFLTGAAVAGQCTTDFGSNSITWSAPLYVVGNLCLSNNGDVIKEVTDPVDLQVGGTLVLNRNGTGSSQATIGDWTNTSSPIGITSGVVVGGCATTITGTTSACDGGSYRYEVNGKDTFVQQADIMPQLADSQAEADYTAFDPGPKNPCATQVTGDPATIASNKFDVTPSVGEGTSSMMPDNSGSGTSGTAFPLTPSGSTYACISAHGYQTGYLIWNGTSSSITVKGANNLVVPASTLAMNGSIFFDSPLSITQSFTYMGTAIIMVAGKITLSGNSSICAQNTSCTFSNWQTQNGVDTGHDDMLTLATLLKSSATAIEETSAVTYMGSFWTQPTSGITYDKSGSVTMGPLAAGAIDISNTANQFTFKPLPTISNMPANAPIPPNVSAKVDPLHVLG